MDEQTEATVGIAFSADDPQSLVDAIKVITETFDRRISALESAVECSDFTNRLIATIESLPEGAQIAKVATYAGLRELILPWVRAFVEAGGGDADALAKFVVGQTVAKLALVTRDGQRVDED